MSFDFARLQWDAVAPVRKHADDAGVDVFAAGDVWIWPFSMGKVHTGVTVDIPRGTALLVWPKSGGDHVIGAGVLDAGYTGEVMVKILNYRPWPIRIKAGAPLGQLVKVNVLTEPVVEHPLAEMHRAFSERGATGGILR